MRARLFHRVAVAGALACLVACRPDGSRVEGPGEPEATPTPTPSPAAQKTPQPLYVPRANMETARLFNGVHVRATVVSEPGGTATSERNTLSSYELELTLRVKIPQAHQNLAALTQINEKLPEALPWLANLLPSAVVDPAYEELYRRKMALTERRLVRLDQLMTRHDFFDCETILRLRNPETNRTALLLQADMDVDTDGSDGDRIPNPDGKDPYFQPMTSYKWPKQTSHPNPFLAASEAKLKARQEELAKARGLGEARMQALRDAVGAARYEVTQLKQFSFLISETDPYIVVPGFMLRGSDTEYTPKIGDYCAVIYDDVIYPAILGDAGPVTKVGEASLRLAKTINSKATAYSRPVSHLKVTYLIFPGSADPKPGPPDLDKWREKVETLLNEMGGYGGRLYAWETIAKPVPTPTPTPSPTPTPTPEASPQPEPTPTPESSATPEGSPTPAATPGAGLQGSPTPLPSPAAGENS